MYKRILVPLDGSQRAESAVPVAARIARAYGGSITLLRVTSTPVEYGPYIAPSKSFATREVKEELEEARKYLEGVAKSEELKGIDTRVEALFGAVAPTITAAMETFHVGLVVMCSHGYTGFKRWILGSVAELVVRHAPVPVLVLREDAAPIPVEKPVHALVALDGSPFSEAVFEPVAYLAAGLSQATSPCGVLHLLRVVDLPFTGGPLRSQAYIDTGTREKAKQEAQSYLEKLELRLSEAGLANLDIAVRKSVVFDPDIAEAIVKEADNAVDGPYNLIAMATHGREGMQHFVMGSVAERVLHHTKLPVLLVRPQQLAASEAAKEENAGKEDADVIEVTQVEIQSWSALL